MSTLAQLQSLELNPFSITTGGESRINNPFGIGYSSPLVPRAPASYENLASDAWTAPMSSALLDPASIEVTIEEILLTANSFLIQTILPLQVTDKLQQRWTKFVFKPYLPNKMPYFSVARFVKGETESREAALVRVGLGFTLEQNFMASRLGQIFYLQHMKQISQGFLEQLQADAIIALLDADMWSNDAIARRRDINGKVFVEQAKTIMEREVNLWNYMQKTDNAWAQLNLWVDTRIAYYTNEKLNTWIIDHRIDGHRKHVPRDQTDYYLFGPGNQNNIRDGIQYFSRDELGNAVYCTRGYRIDDRPEFNPLENLQQTGEYYVGLDLPTTDYSIYTTRDRSLSIYNEDLDAMSTVTLPMMIENCQRFNSKGDLLATNQLPKNTSGDVQDLDQDFLYHKINGTVVPKTFFGQLESAHFNEADKQNLGESVCTALKMNMTSAQIGTMLKELLSCVSVIFNTLPGTIATWNNAVSNSTTSPESFQLNDTNINGIVELNWALPITHATYRGFKEIEKQANTPNSALSLRQAFSSKYIDIIQKNMPLFDSYVQMLDSMFPGCALLHPSGAGVNISKPTMYDVAFENVFRREYPFIPISIGAPATLPTYTQTNGTYLELRMNVVVQLMERNNIAARDNRVLFDYSANQSINYMAALLSAAYIFVSFNNGSNFPEIFNQFRTIRVKFTNDFDIAELNRFVDAFNGIPELRTLRDAILTIISTTTAKPLVISTTAVGASITANQSATPDTTINAPDDWRNTVDTASSYEDRFNGSATNINALPLIVNLRANPGAQSPASASPPVPTSTLVAPSARRSSGRVGGSVGAFGSSSQSSQNFLPTATSYTSSNRTTINPKIDDIATTLTTAFKHHYTQACQRFSSEPQYLIPVLMFLFTKITKFSVSASATHGFWHPFDYIIARPHMLYSTVSAIKTIPGSGTGNTYIAQMSANVANDNQTDETMVHIAGWTGAIVTAQNRTFTAPNILVTKYHKGNGIGMIAPSDYNPSQGVFGATNDASLIILAQPRNQKYGKCFSLSGELSMTNALGQTVAIRSSDDNQWTYNSAPFYRRVYGFNYVNWKMPVRALQTKEKFVPNNIVYSSVTLYWNQIKREYTVCTVNTGHWDTKLVGPAKGAQRIGAHALDDRTILSGTTQANLSCIY